MGMINGGLHATAWNSHFPTSTECVLWRISTLGVGLLFLFLYFIIWKGSTELRVVRECYEVRFRSDPSVLRVLLRFFHDAIIGDIMEGRPPDRAIRFPIWIRYLLGGLALFTFFGYTASILYLTIESFISVRSLPKGAYSTVEWSDYLPHF
jgi:hypothetical protein